MKTNAIAKVLALLQEKVLQQASDAVSEIPVGGTPENLPADPVTEAMGPPDVVPPVDTNEVPEVDPFTGLPMIAVESTPDEFPGNDDHVADVEALDALFDI